MAAKVYGDRKCHHCEGLCHKGSWRTNYGQRKRYWCSSDCALHDLTPMIPLEDISWLERVDVISR